MLVHTWLEAERELFRHSEKEAREAMNAALGTKYVHGNVHRWKTGTMPYKDVRLYMLDRCFRYFLEMKMPELDLRNEADVRRAYEQLV